MPSKAELPTGERSAEQKPDAKPSNKGAIAATVACFLTAASPLYPSAIGQTLIATGLMNPDRGISDTDRAATPAREVRVFEVSFLKK